MFGNKEEKQAKKMAKDEALLEKYGLTNIDPMDAESVRKILSDLAGNGLIKTGMALSFANAAEQAKVTYLSALVEQNWIIIRQLDRLNKTLGK